jgi:glycosyltransferase involved in cell wall biosynthesis
VQGGDVNFDPEFQESQPDQACRLRLKNANFELHFPIADGGLSPTQWQRSVFPEPFRSRITVMHDGIDTERLRPNPSAQLRIKSRFGEVELNQGDEIITFVNRNLEPYRGYHTFMRALPDVLRQRPNARVLIVGGDEVSYGSPPGPGEDGRPRRWKDVFLNEVKAQLDLSRIHFLGRIPYARFVTLLQLSTVHIYLTYPFVLSWSLLEAMSTGCAIVASDTKPLHEAIRHNDTGLLVDFFSPSQITESVCALLDDPSQRARLGDRARAFAQAHYDLESICLPRQLEWVRELGQNF